MDDILKLIDADVRLISQMGYNATNIEISRVRFTDDVIESALVNLTENGFTVHTTEFSSYVSMDISWPSSMWDLLCGNVQVPSNYVL